MGWIGHEAQWRGGYVEMGNRQMISAHSIAPTIGKKLNAILNQYHITYVYVGDLENLTYAVDEAKFQEHLQLAFDLPSAKIYVYSTGQ